MRICISCKKSEKDALHPDLCTVSDTGYHAFVSEQIFKKYYEAEPLSRDG